jgi:hypothetical protein
MLFGLLCPFCALGFSVLGRILIHNSFQTTITIIHSSQAIVEDPLGDFSKCYIIFIKKTITPVNL